MSRKFDFLVFIGRFQPFHHGHLEVIKTALDQADRVIVLVGSSNQPRTEKNPFNFDERRLMIYHAVEDISEDLADRVEVYPLQDQKYNDTVWAEQVQTRVDHTVVSIGLKRDTARVGLIGHSKDESSYYLKMFPQWEVIEHEMNEQINATDLRKLMFEGKSTRFLSGVVPEGAMCHVEQFLKSPEYDVVKREYDMIKKYKKAWEAAPYAPTFVTVDAVVIQSGHVCLIQRKAAPGEGLWAVPGGFLDQGEYIQQGVIRELREETKMKVPDPVLIGNIKEWKVFDRPDRSARGRTITHAALIVLPPGPLPKIKGSDDAKDAKWVPLAEVREDMMFEDHFHMVQYFKGLVGK